MYISPSLTVKQSSALSQSLTWYSLAALSIWKIYTVLPSCSKTIFPTLYFTVYSPSRLALSRFIVSDMARLIKPFTLSLCSSAWIFISSYNGFCISRGMRFRFSFAYLYIDSFRFSEIAKMTLPLSLYQHYITFRKMCTYTKLTNIERGYVHIFDKYASWRICTYLL